MITENEIRPNNLVEQQQQYIEQDINYLIKRKDKFIEVNCPTCSTENEKIELEKNGFLYRECENCGMLYMSPRPPLQVLNEFYSKSVNYKFFNDYIFPASAEVRREKIFIPRVKKVLDIAKKHRVDTRKIIEIGVGYGLFCEEMVKTGVFSEVVGVEATDALYESAIGKGYRLYHGLLESLNINEKFDFCVSFEVIEHVYNPCGFVKEISNVLNVNSLLMLTFPNYEGFDVSVLRERSSAIDHEHLNYFTENSIRHLLKKTGFEIISIETPGQLDFDIVKKQVLNGKFRAQKFIEKLCHSEAKVGEEFQDFLMRNNLSSHMMVVAKKIL